MEHANTLSLKSTVQSVPCTAGSYSSSHETPSVKVFLSVHKSTRIFIKFDISGLFENLPRKFKLRCSFSKWPTWRTILLFYNTFITVLYIFRATSCSSSGGQIVLIQHLVSSETAVAQWLRCCATNRKVAGSIPDGVIGIFHWHNTPDRIMALESTQPLTEMSTRRISWG